MFVHSWSHCVNELLFHIRSICEHVYKILDTETVGVLNKIIQSVRAYRPTLLNTIKSESNPLNQLLN